MDYDALIERLLDYFSTGRFEAEVTMAKTEFFEMTGGRTDNPAYFEERMCQFLDWYVFSRPLSSHDMPPVQMALHCIDFDADEAERQCYNNLAEAKHSLFEYVKVSNKGIHVKDLFDGTKVTLRLSPPVHGFHGEEIFEARIIPHDGAYVFAKGLCFHPPQTKKFILKQVKRVRKLGPEAREELMLRFLGMRYRHDQYKHLPLDKVYSLDSDSWFAVPAMRTAFDR